MDHRLRSFVLVVLVGGCGFYGTEPPPGYRQPGGRGPGAELEQVLLKIAEVPADVRCVRITAVGPSRTVVREIEATGGATMAETLTGLPIGTVTFTGEAFGTSCSAVSKSSVAPWASAPVETSIVVGRLTTVELTMVRNGRAKVQVGFSDEAACTPLAAACRINTECCSRKCSAGICTVPDASTSD